MRHHLTGLLAGALVPGLLLLGSAGHAAEIGEHTIKFASQNTKGHPQVTGMEKFKELVEEKSDGNITVRLFPGGTLGGDVQTISALQGGTVEMSVMNAGLLSGNVQDFVVVDFPFLFDSPEQAAEVMDGPVGEALAAKLPETGLVGLGYWELGFRDLTNNQRAITKADDIAGLKIRTLQSPLYIELFNALGANAVPMPFPEVYTALETGAIDGQENPASVILSSKFAEVQDHLTLTHHTYNPQIVLISKEFWDGLNADEQKLLQDAAVEARDYQRQVAREYNDEALEELKSEGMEVTELPPEEMEKLREKAKPVVEKFSEQVDPALMQQLQEAVAKGSGKG
jgi:tripartite ATP-independent transporter DctP family solute receptor